MADERVKIIDIQVKYQQAVDALAKFRSSLAEAKKYQADLKKELKDGTITQEQYDRSMEASNVYIRQQSEQMRTLAKQVNNQIKVTHEQEGSLKQLRAELSNATAKWDAMSRAERESAKGKDLKDHINQITTELKAAEEETQRFYRNVGNYKSATEGLENIRVKLVDLRNQIVAAFGAAQMLAFGKDALQVTRDFQDGMARVKAVTNATEEDMKKMTDEARKMGRETIFHATDAANAMENLARGGFDAEESTTALSKTLQLAQANTIDLKEASDLMIRTMRGFELPITEEEMEHANDVLSKTAASSTTNISELGEALKNAAPFGHSLNQSIEEVNAALGVLADVGIRGADAGTALRMVILGLSSPTAKQQKVFKDYGIEISQASLQSEGLTKTLQRLKNSGIMEASNSAELLGDVFGRRATPQVMALVGNIGRLQEKLETLQEAQGTTERMFKDSYSNVSQEIFGLSSAWESFKISIGESNNQALIEPVKALREGIIWLEGHLPELGHFIVSLIASISFLKLVSEAKAAFTTIRNSAVSNAEEASNTVRTLQNQEVQLRKTTAMQEQQILTASGNERMMLEAKILANKREIAETEKALVKAKTNEIKMWEQAAAVNSGNSWKAAMAAATMATQAFFTAAKTAAKTFILTALFQLAFEALYGLIDLMSGATEGDGVFAKLTRAVTGFIKQAINWLVTQIKAVVAWFKNFIENSRLMQVWIIALKAEFAALALIFKTLWTILKTGLKQIVNMFKGLLSVVGGVATALEGLFTLNFDNVKAGIKQVGKAVTDFWKNTTDNFKSGAEEMVGNTKKALKDIKGAVNDAANSKAFGGPGTDSNSGGGKTTAPKKKPTKPAPTNPEPVVDDDGGTGGSGGGGGGGSTNGDKGRENRIKKQAELERKALEEAEQALLDLMKDTASKRRAQLEKRYNDEIRKLKVRLETEKNLTETAKEAIQKTILLKEKKLAEELAKLDDEELKREIQDRQKLIESRLSVARKGSEEELNLKRRQNQEKANLDVLALKEEEENKIADAEEKLRIAEETYGKESVMALAAQEDLTRIEAEFEERRNNIREAARQRNLELEQQYQQQLISLRQQAFQNQITELQIQMEEQHLLEQEDAEIYLNQQEGFQMLNLQVVEQGELDILEVKRQAAEEKYNDLVAAGQLEGETVEQFNARILAAEQNMVNAKAALRQAELKNEKAYLNSSKSITNSLISLTAAIGESDEDFAKLSKILTLVQITIDTGKAISAGVASASKLPYPANLAAIATTVATVLANIATAVSTVNSAKFAEGGKVTGPGTGTSDSIPAYLSNGEYVMTAKATRMFEPLLAAMNNVGVGVIPMQATNSYRDYNMPTEELTESFKEAASNIRPVVSVTDINEGQQRVEVIESLDTI